MAQASSPAAIWSGPVRSAVARAYVLISREVNKREGASDYRTRTTGAASAGGSSNNGTDAYVDGNDGVGLRGKG